MPKKRRPSSTARKRSPSPRQRTTRRKSTRAAARIVASRGGLTVSEVAKLDDLRRELERTSATSSPLRWNADADDVQRSVAQLVLTLVEFIRKLLERQAIRRMEAGTLTKIGDFYLAPGYSTEFMGVFLATDLKHNPLDPDADEFLSVEKISVKKVFEIAVRGDMPDAKSLAALLLARPHLEKYLG